MSLPAGSSAGASLARRRRHSSSTLSNRRYASDSLSPAAVSFIIATEAFKADSTGRRNTSFPLLPREELVQDFSRRLPAESLSRPGVHRMSNSFEFTGGVLAEVCAFGKVLTQQAIGILV
jgi:hypothetical protein